ncbi:MAG TPA: hypothetical protein VOA78_08320 [Candidatus Dormibacteraeota bacterium]|nr:hypothetical protein [Candidatus Dormibacteraeota bacterium]
MSAANCGLKVRKILKLALTPFWLSVSAVRTVAVLAVAGSLCAQQLGAQAARRNELTLGRLRPGKHSIEQAKALYKDGSAGKDPLPDPLIWEAASAQTDTRLRFEGDARHILQEIVASRPRAMLEASRQANRIAVTFATDRRPAKAESPLWKTGLGLGLGDACGKAVKLYGNPDSRSPSTKDGQPLQLLYYAFDWAGPDVPQVMQVVCTPEQDGQAGRVVEITLAASSL